MKIGLLKNLYIFGIIQYDIDTTHRLMSCFFVLPHFQPRIKNTGFASFQYYRLQYAFMGGTT